LKAAKIDRKGFPAKQGFTLHDLRHTFGTLAVQVWPLHDVQAFMGHADIQTTMIYAHHVPRVDAAQQFTQFVQQQKDGTSGIRLGDVPSREPIPVAANAVTSGDFERARQDSNL
jgi:Phage integrase family